MIWLYAIGTVYGIALLKALRHCSKGGQLHNWNTTGETRECTTCRSKQHRDYHTFEQFDGPEFVGWVYTKTDTKPQPLPKATLQ